MRSAAENYLISCKSLFRHRDRRENLEFLSGFPQKALCSLWLMLSLMQEVNYFKLPA